MSLDINALDFERCEDEPIHIPESIQSYGYLFAFNRDDSSICIISENVKDILPAGESIINQDFFSLLDEDDEGLKFLKNTLSRAHDKSTRLPVRLCFSADKIANDKAKEYLAVVYSSGDLYVIELEPATKFREIYSTEHYVKLYAMSIAPRFKTFSTLSQMAQEVVDTIKFITGMDRVVLYRFNEDHSGRVIAEAKEDDIDSYMDLYYPASDIPSQARDLYKVNWVRLTPNVNLESSKLIPTREASGRAPLDMTHSLLRSLSPIHLQYVRNQGLQASFSISLVTHDRLWGLISCHHREPTYLPQDVRLQCENLSQLFSWHLFAKEEEILLKKKLSTDAAVEKMLEKVAPSNPIVQVFRNSADEVLSAMEADGFIFHSQQETISIGETPKLDVVQNLFTNAREKNALPWITDELSQFYDERDIGKIAGAMIIPLIEKKHYFTAWFRNERKITQRWAGVEKENDAHASKKERLTPRASFKINIKEIAGKSKPFDSYDVDMASRLNRMFLVHALEQQDRMHTRIVQLKKQDQYRNEFLATLAHELRNPLAPISAGVALLERHNSDEVKKQVVDTIKRQSDYMSKLIDDLMDVARITRGKIKLSLEKISVQEIIRHSLEIIEQGIKEKGHAISIDMPKKTLFVEGDRARLSQIFSNILNNASKYTESSGKIDISVNEIGNIVSVTISDNGLGIPPDRLEDVFNMFTQIEAHSTYTKGGLGIGLTLVEKLVRLHKGNINVHSEGIGKGSSFEVRLPMIEHQDKKSLQAERLSSNYGNNKKVLFVDDKQDITTLYQLLFESAGYDVRTATNGHDAIAIFKNFKPHFAFLDIGMPDMDGYELCRKLKGLTESSATVFFAQSGWGSKEDIDQAKEAGFDEHFVKPLSIETIENVLKRYLKTES